MSPAPPARLRGPRAPPRAPRARPRGVAAGRADRHRRRGAAAPPALHDSEALAVLAATAALARRPEALGRGTASPPCLILVAEACVARRGSVVALGHDLALVDPDLDADDPEGRLRLRLAVVDVRADRVQRNATLGVHLAPAHLTAAESAACGDLDSLSTRAHRRGERALHRAPEAHTVLELLRDRLRDELRVELGPLDLVDVDVDVLLRDRVQLFAQRVHLDARLADHDARARRVDVHGDPLFVLADENVRQARVRQLPEDVLADANVLEEVVGELVLARPPVRLPVVDDADAEAAGMHFLAHQATASFFLRRDAAPALDCFALVSSAAGVSAACLRDRRLGVCASGCSARTRVT